MAEKQRWVCPQCGLTYRIKRSSEPPEVCPDCEGALDDQPDEHVSGLPDFVPSYSSQSRTNVKKSFHPFLLFLSHLCYVFAVLSVVVSVFEAMEIESQLGVRTAIGVMLAGVVAGLTTAAIGGTLSVVIRIHVNQNDER